MTGPTEGPRVGSNVSEMLRQRRKDVEAKHERIRSVINDMSLQGIRLTVAGVAKRAGVSRTTVYRHYGDRFDAPLPPVAEIAEVPDDNLVAVLARQLREAKAAHAREKAEMTEQIVRLRSEIIHLRREARR